MRGFHKKKKTCNTATSPSNLLASISPLLPFTSAHLSNSPSFYTHLLLSVPSLLSLPLSLSADQYLGLNWLKGEKRLVKLRRQAVGGRPAYLSGLFMLQE